MADDRYESAVDIVARHAERCYYAHRTANTLLRVDQQIAVAVVDHIKEIAPLPTRDEYEAALDYFAQRAEGVEP